jgi:flagellar basal-body rod modification protein FlgD
MSTTNGIDGSSGTTATGTTTKKDNSMLGKDDFLKLMVAQMKNMDPMNASNSSEDSMAQMTQFSILEQITNLATSTAQLNASTRQAQSLSLIGKTVTYTNGDGAAVSGVVEKAALDNGVVSLTVAGVDGIDPAGVTEVQ